MTVASSIPMVLLSKGMGAQEAQVKSGMWTSTIQIREMAKGVNCAQIICKEVKKAFRKQSHMRKKPCANNSESDSNSDSILTRFRLHSDSIPTQLRLDSDSIPTRFRLDSDSILTRFRLNSDSIPT